MAKKHNWDHEATLKIPIYTYLASSFLGATAILFLVVGFFAISRGRIFLTLKTETLPVDFSVNAKAEPGTGELFGLVREVTVDGQASAPVPQSTTTVGKAQGQVTFFNLSSVPQPLVATTRLLSPDKVLFRITKNVTVPAQGKITVAAAADLPGKQGEIAPTTFIIPGLKSTRQKEVYAKSEAPMITTSETTSAVNQELIDQTTNKLKEKLLDQAWEKIQALPKTSDTNRTPPPFQKNLLDAKITSRKISAPVGAKVAQISVTLSLTVRAVAVDLVQIQNLALQKIKETLPQSKAVSIDPASLTISVQATSLDPETASLHVQAKTQAQSKADDPAFAKQHFLGLSPEAVQQYFKEVPSVKKADVKISPFWVTTMPANESRIKVFFLNAL